MRRKNASKPSQAGLAFVAAIFLSLARCWTCLSSILLRATNRDMSFLSKRLLMSLTRFVFAIIGALLVCLVVSSFNRAVAAESKPTWQAKWERAVKAAEEEGAVVIYMTQAFEPVFRENFQKKYPKIKVITVTGRGFQLSQRVMNERRAERYITD